MVVGQLGNLHHALLFLVREDRVAPLLFELHLLLPPLDLLQDFGAVVADAPSPLSTPRSAAGQAQLRLGKPLRMKCRASPVLLFMRAGRVVAGTVGIVRATVPFSRGARRAGADQG